MKLKRIKRNYLIFSKKERNAALVLILLISTVLAAPFVDRQLSADPEPADYTAMKSHFKLVQNEDQANSENSDWFEHKINSGDRSGINGEMNDPAITRHLFYFNPNTISKEEWLQLGIPDAIAERIIKFKSKGGEFRKQEDLLKIYGFRQTDFDAIAEYITIEKVANKKLEQETVRENVNPAEFKLTEINSAGIDELIALGFSSAVANRIVNFRNGLGGIYSIDQISSVFGMDMEILNTAKPFITIDVNLLQTIPLNSCNFEQLAKHSYISDELAQAIVDYRTVTGRFVSVAEVVKVKGMYPALFEKLKPYLTL